MRVGPWTWLPIEAKYGYKVGKNVFLLGRKAAELAFYIGSALKEIIALFLSCHVHEINLKNNPSRYVAK